MYSLYEKNIILMVIYEPIFTELVNSSATFHPLISWTFSEFVEWNMGNLYFGEYPQAVACLVQPDKKTAKV